MRTQCLLRTGWQVTGPDGTTQAVTLPHTWKACRQQQKNAR